jgi:hypothetical protein
MRSHAYRNSLLVLSLSPAFLVVQARAQDLPQGDRAPCGDACYYEPIVFRFWTDPNEPCFFRMYIDEQISPGQTVSSNVAWGDYSWDYTITCERTGEGVGPCVRSWPTGCDGFCDKCQYVFTLEATAHGPGCDGQHRQCVSMVVHVEGPTNCGEDECGASECKILYPDGEDQYGEYTAFLCSFFTIVQVYVDSSTCWPSTTPGCDDGDPCTDDYCVDGQCEHEDACDDNDPCTDDYCVDGDCYYVDACDDDDPCTDDCCVDEICRHDRPAQACDVLLAPETITTCPGSTVPICAQVCNTSDCLETYYWSAETPPPSMQIGNPTGGPSLPSISPSSGFVTLPGQQCTDVCFDVYFPPDSPPGVTALIDFTVTSYGGGICGPVSTSIWSGTSRVTAAGIDLDVDSNNDGQIGSDDDRVEDDAPGKWVWANNDDSDGDGTSDDTNDEIDGPADLAEDFALLVVRPVADVLPAGWCLYLECSGPPWVRVFEGASITSVPILGPDLPARADISQYIRGSTFAFEGLVPGECTFGLVLEDDLGREVCRDEVLVSVVLLNVTWLTLQRLPICDVNEYYQSHAPWEPPPTPDPLALGLRYFADALNPGGPWEDTLRVRVSTFPPVNGATVHVRAFDPDDPSANNNSVDGDLIGGDNRGGPGVLVGTQLTTGNVEGPGQAEVLVHLPHQPGDNVRVAATLKASALDTLNDDNVPPSGTDPATEGQPETFIGGISPLLTIWRTLWLEADSMSQEPMDAAGRCENNEWVVFTPVDSEDDFPDAGFSTVYLMLGLPPSMANEWEGGRFIRKDIDQECLVVRNTPAEIVLWGGIGSVAGIECEVHDDDPDDPEDRQLPHLDTLLTPEATRAYAYGFIDLRESPGAWNPNRIVPFTSNKSDASFIFDYTFAVGVCGQRDMGSNQAFWVRHVVVCYQGSPGADADPDAWENCGQSVNCGTAPYPSEELSYLGDTAEDSVKGITTRAWPRKTATSLLFKEVIRDTEPMTTGRLWQYLAHEVGHKPVPAQSEAEDHAELGLMTGGDSGGMMQDIPQYRVFSPETLARFRGVDRW